MLGRCPGSEPPASSGRPLPALVQRARHVTCRGHGSVVLVRNGHSNPPFSARVLFLPSLRQILRIGCIPTQSFSFVSWRSIPSLPKVLQKWKQRIHKAGQGRGKPAVGNGDKRRSNGETVHIHGHTRMPTRVSSPLPLSASLSRSLSLSLSPSPSPSPSPSLSRTVFENYIRA